MTYREVLFRIKRLECDFKRLSKILTGQLEHSKLGTCQEQQKNHT